MVQRTKVFVRLSHVFFFMCMFILFCAATGYAGQLDSREYKFLIKSDCFNDRLQGYNDYWSKVKTIADDAGIKVVEAEQPFVENIREVNFLDTESLALAKQNYILRIRTKMSEDGTLASKCDLTLKYRVSEFDQVNHNWVQTRPNYKPSIKLEEDIVGFNQSKAGLNVKKLSLSYSIKKIPICERSTLGDYTEFFPILGQLGISLSEPLQLVNGLVIREYKVSPGTFDFGNGVKSDVVISVWYNASTEKLIIGEFSYNVNFKSTVSQETVDRIDNFFNVLQERTQSDLYPGKTKSALCL